MRDRRRRAELIAARQLSVLPFHEDVPFHQEAVSCLFIERPCRHEDAVPCLFRERRCRAFS